MKYAVYVEGKSEMLFVADILGKYSSYNPTTIGFKCINLNSDSFKYVPHIVQGDENTSHDYYQIVNVNNDNLVVSKLKRDIPKLISQGFDIIIGLRDVYGELYNKNCSRQHEVDNDLILRMHRAQFGQIKYGNADTRLHFAVMEYEAWMMALLHKYIKNKGQDPVNVFTAAGVDYNSDFEQIYHPNKQVCDIFKVMGSNYNKHEKDHLAFLNCLEWKDYEELLKSNRCASFRSFVESLLGLDTIPNMIE